MKREKEGGEEERRGEVSGAIPSLIKVGDESRGGQAPNRGRQGWSAATRESYTPLVYIQTISHTGNTHTHTQMMMHLDRYTRNAHNTHTSQTQTYLSLHAVCRGHTDQKLNLALWLCAVSRCSLRPVECFTGALGPNTQTL